MAGESLFACADARIVELRTPDLPALQRFFEQNADYFVLVNGEPPPPGEAEEEMHGELPTGWPFTKKWIIGYVGADGELVAMANVVSDLLAPHVWHVGLYIVAPALRGSGAAARWYGALESWMRASGARWIRLGVVAGNARAERFWQARGYRELRVRTGVEMGVRVNDVRVLMKPLAGGTAAEYLELVPRDRPDA